MITTALRSSYIVSPRFDDYEIREVEVTTDPDFENEIKQLISETRTDNGGKNFKSNDDIKKSENELKKVTKKISLLESGNIGDIQSMTSAQFGNVRALATNPVQFMMGTVFKKLSRGVGVIGLALILMEAVKFIINEMMKPGRLLDRRFKRDIENEIFAFRSREEKQKLRQGFNNIIITSIGGLRGGAGQISSSRGLIATGQIDRVLNTAFSQPGTSGVSTGLDLKTRVGKPGSVFN
jgi:hypothetical protein